MAFIADNGGIVMKIRAYLREHKNSSFLLLLQWSFIALAAAAVGNLSVGLFMNLYSLLTGLVESVRFIPLLVWPVLAALPLGLILYTAVPSSMGEGIPSYLEGVRKNHGILSFRETLFNFMASVITLGCHGNGGFLGPIGRLSSGIMSLLGRGCLSLGYSRTLLPLFPICGLASTVGVLLHSPIGGGIFAVEIILKTNMRYRQLFPAILASTAAVYLARFSGLEPLFRIVAPYAAMDAGIVVTILVLTVTAGLAGKVFILSYARVSRFFRRNQILRPVHRTFILMTGTAASSLLLIVNPHLIGKSGAVFEGLMQNDHSFLYGALPPELPLFLVIFIMVLIKGSANILTVGSGMSAGFTGPAILMGLLMGAGVADLFGIPAGSTEFYALMAAGFAGYFASIMNTPIAAAVITVELFGLHYSLAAGLAAVVGFMVNQDHTLYDLALEEREDRLEDQEY